MTRILIVDDEPSIRHTVTTLLKLEGYDVGSAPDGRAALEQILAAAPDVVISDVRMPHMDGNTLLRAVRANPALTNVRFILMASLVDDTPAAHGAEALADAYMSKPFTRDRLLQALRSLGA